MFRASISPVLENLSSAQRTTRNGSMCSWLAYIARSVYQHNNMEELVKNIRLLASCKSGSSVCRPERQVHVWWKNKGMAKLWVKSSWFCRRTMRTSCWMEACNSPSRQRKNSLRRNIWKRTSVVKSRHTLKHEIRKNATNLMRMSSPYSFLPDSDTTW